MINETVFDYGSMSTVQRSIEHPDERASTMLAFDIKDGKFIGVTFEFNGTRCCSTSKSTIEELARFKQLLNSFVGL